MPPEQLPWDRKERKHERSSESLLGGSSPSVSRWRDNNHHGSSRWSSADFRRSSGNGKQGSGWHMFSEESGSRGDGERKYARRENRAGFSGHQEWKGHAWETTASPNGNSYPHSDFVNSWDQVQSKVQDDKNGGVSNTGQRLERENSIGLIDWKPLKWNRSASLSSRGSGFSHSSSSKSMGVDSAEMKVNVQVNNVNLVQSPSGDVNGCIAFSAPSEDVGSRKKPRLGWGEGLAKYEKKKVEGPDEALPKEISSTDSAAKDAMGDGANNLETLHSNLVNVMEKSPSLTGFSECASPATPSSVACSSSPGVEEKSCPKTSSDHNGVGNSITSPCPVSMNQSDGLALNLENLELTQFANLSSTLTELLQSDDPSSVDFGFVRSTAMNKLLVCKADISKTLEMTESEIDLLENELKLLLSDSGCACACPAASTSLLEESKVNPSEEQCAVSDVVSRTSPLEMSGDICMEMTRDGREEVHTEVKDEGVDGACFATSELEESLSSRKDVICSDAVRPSDCLMNSGSRPDNLKVKHFNGGVTEVVPSVVSAADDASQPTPSTSSGAHSAYVGVNHLENMAYDMILASNRDSVNRSLEDFSFQLPKIMMSFCISRATSVPCSQDKLQIKENYARKLRSRRLKERLITFKYRALQHLWKEDLRLLAIRRYRAKAQKKYDSSFRSVHDGYQKHRSSIRSRLSSPAGSLSLVPTSEFVSYTNKLFSDSQVKLYRDALKMPALMLDEREKIVSRFISYNGLVEDPLAVEKERSLVNPWTPQETDVFLNKLSTFGKDFKKISSFLDHKTTADCVEFYYKNHKSDSFQKTKKKSETSRQGKLYSPNTYLVTSGKRRNHETNAASLDMLGAVSEIAANADGGLENRPKCTSRYFIGMSKEYKKRQGNNDGSPERVNVFGNERETAAADVLAGICGSMSSEAMSSCITSSIDPGDGYPQNLRCQKPGGSSKKRHAVVEVKQRVIDDETCSDESCGEEMNSSDWTDEEKSLFIQAVASYGKDFAMISRYMRTRSSDQCKIYFSKARKCLGLDVIHPEPCSIGTAGANGGYGSDAEDAYMVEADSTICGTKVSSGKTEEQELQLSDLKVEHTDSALAEHMNLQQDSNQLEDKKDVELKLDVLVPNDSRIEHKSDNDLASASKTENSYSESLSEANEDTGNAKARDSEEIEHAIAEEVASVEERNDHGLPSTAGDKVGKEAVWKVSAECSEEIVSREITLVPASAGLVSTVSEFSGKTICPARDSDSPHHSAGDRNSSLEVEVDHKVAMEMDTAQKPCLISLGRDNGSQASNSCSQDNIVQVHHRKALSHEDVSSKLEFRKSSGRGFKKSASTDGNQQHLPMHSLMDCVESSQILRGYPITLSNKNGDNGDVSCNEPSVSNLDKNKFQVDRYLSRDSFLQKCNGSRHNNGLTQELPYLSHVQKQGSLSEVEKPCKSGDFKLFGQIVSHQSSQQPKPRCSTSSTRDNEDKGGGAHFHPTLNGGGKSFNLKFGDNQNIDRNLFLPKFEQPNNYLSVESNNKVIPLRRSYGFWDGNKIQACLPSLPDSSAILLAKYPAAFGNHSTSTSKMAQQPSSPGVNSNERGILNGVSVFPSRELISSSSSGRVDEYHQMYKTRDATKLAQPFTADQIRQDFLSQMQRRKEIELLSRRGMVSLNLAGGREGGVLGNGVYNNGVSDPVAAIKMHYAKTEHYGGNVREDESWRGNR